MKDVNQSLYRKMYLCRAAENQITAHYFEDEMKTPMHMSMGEEAIVAGVVQAIQPDGQAVGTFRSHALYLCMAEESDRFFLELYGKQGAIANGKSGSMHLSYPEKGYMGSSAIVASSIPVVCGLAFANKSQALNNVAVAFLGDGATEEGVFWESINLACVMKLPVLFVCEDNSLAVHAPPKIRRGYLSLKKILEQYDCSVYDTNDSTDAFEIYKIACRAKKDIVSSQRPAVIYARYYRYLEHVGVNYDFQAGYRDETEYARWLEKDPLAIMKKKIPSAEVGRIEDEIDKMVSDSLNKARHAPFPEEEELLKGVFVK